MIGLAPRSKHIFACPAPAPLCLGGLTTDEAQQILHGLNIENLVAADVVEVSPAYDASDITAIAAIDVMFELLCIMAAQTISP